MDIFKEIESIAKQGYSIEYQIIDQLANGYKKEIGKGLKPLITYTVYVIRLSDSETVYNESFDHIKDCLEAGIKYFRENLVS
ncbi:hypothetical protein [Clostridium sp.]|uniref:hypothetical protein n=1 Tax=Clostridium sp. TaxID=1506 RepID=UPI003217999D